MQKCIALVRNAHTRGVSASFGPGSREARYGFAPMTYVQSGIQPLLGLSLQKTV
jgi:hypothetical protein